MANIIEYTLSLQDKLSGKLRKIGIENDTQLAKWGAVQQKVAAASRTMTSMGTTVGSLRERVAALRAEREWIPASNIQAIRATNREITSLERQVRKLETTTGGGLKTAFKNAFSSLPMAHLIVNPLVLAATAGFAAVKKGFEREKVQISFEVLTGGKEAGDKLLGDIQRYGAATPYQTAGLQENAKTMLSFGIAQERIMPNLKMLGDIAGGSQEKMDALSLAFSQMTSTGKLTGQDLLQMINAGFNPLNEISKKTGKSVASLKDAMGKGKISSEMVRDAFISATSAGGQFYGMTEKLGQSKSGRWATILDKGVQLLWKLYDIIEPAINPALSALSWIINVVSKGLSGIVNGFKWWIDKLREGQPVILAITAVIGALTLYMMAASLWSGIVAAKTKLWAGAQLILNAIMTANPVGLIIAGIIALIAVIAYVCYKTEGWGTLWDGVVGFMKYTFFAFVDGVKLYFSTVINGIMIGLDYIKLGWYKFKEAVGMGDSAENQAAIAKINADVEARQRAITDGAKKVLDNARKAQESLAGINLTWNSEKSLGDLVGGMKSKLGIGAASVPGMGGGGVTGDGGDGGDGGRGGSGGGAVESVAAGGSRSTTINITLGSLVEAIYYQGGFGENREQFERDMESALIRVLQMANTTN